MINYLEKTGKTDDEAIAAALEEIGLDRDDVSVEIIERAKPGFLGIGSVPARVRVSWESEDEEPEAAALRKRPRKPLLPRPKPLPRRSRASLFRRLPRLRMSPRIISGYAVS